MKAIKESCETALWHKIFRSNDDLVRTRRKLRNNEESVSQQEGFKSSIDAVFISRYGECFHATRDCKTIVDLISNLNGSGSAV